MESVEAPRVDPGFGEEGPLSSLSLSAVVPGERGRRKEQDEQMSTMSYGAA